MLLLLITFLAETAGVYTVTVTVTDEAGNKISKALEVTVLKLLLLIQEQANPEQVNQERANRDQVNLEPVNQATVSQD